MEGTIDSDDEMSFVSNDTLQHLAVWLHSAIDPLVTESIAKKDHIEVEIGLGRMRYLKEGTAWFEHVVPNSGLITTSRNSTVKIPGITPPYDEIISDDWKPVGAVDNLEMNDWLAVCERLDAVTSQLRIRRVVDEGGLPSAPIQEHQIVKAFTEWTVSHHMNLDPYVDIGSIMSQNPEASHQNEGGRIRFEKLRIQHADQLPFLVYANAECAARIFKQYKPLEGNGYAGDVEIQTYCLIKKESPEAIQWVSNRSIKANETKNGKHPSFDNSILANRGTANLKRKIAAPTMMMTRMARFTDATIFVNYEERVSVKRNANSDETLVPAHGECKSLIVNANTYLAPTPVVSCKMSVYLGLSDAGEIVLTRESRDMAFWRVDISVGWRPSLRQQKIVSLNDLLIAANACKSALLHGDRSILEKILRHPEQPCKPSFELEIECINVVELLLLLNGDYLQFTKSLLEALVAVQHMILLPESSPAQQNSTVNVGLNQVSSDTHRACLPDAMYQLFTESS